jgi:hypothetical protein
VGLSGCVQELGCVQCVSFFSLCNCAVLLFIQRRAAEFVFVVFFDMSPHERIITAA